MGDDSIPVLLLRLEGALQAWGTRSVLRTRDTGAEPSRSGVIGLIACCMGLRRDADLSPFAGIRMGVRADRPGILWRDYHTVGASIGCMTAGGKIKLTATTGEFEALPSDRFYLCDASFLVALAGPLDLLERIEAALRHPVWPPFLGRKSCPPSLPVLTRNPIAGFASLEEALTTCPWRPRLADDQPPAEGLRCVLDCEPDEPGASVRVDDPISFDAPRAMRQRFVCEISVKPPLGEVSQAAYRPRRPRRMNYRTMVWKEKRLARGRVDQFLCVFCGVPSYITHHISYERAGDEDVQQDLRSVCRLCHDAVTMLESERDMGLHRIDPVSEEYREAIRRKREQIEAQRTPHSTRPRR